MRAYRYGALPLIFAVILSLVCMSGCEQTGDDGTAVNRCTDTSTDIDDVQDCTGTLPCGDWYKGDLHDHSLYSDGDSPVKDVIAMAEEKGFDFFALTDHDFLPDMAMYPIGVYENIRPLHWDDPDFHSDSTILLYGQEWTTIKGHANVWSDVPFDYSELWRAHNFAYEDESDFSDEAAFIFSNYFLSIPDAGAALEAAHAQNALFSVNHPMAIGTPWIMKVPDGADSMEVWNSMYEFPNLNRFSCGLIWDKQLAKGKRLSAVGGSDTHKLKEGDIEASIFGQGNPSTWVFAAKREGRAILNGIKAGHATISYAPDAGYLDFTADINGDGRDDVMMGDTFVANDDVEVTLAMRYVDENGEIGTDGTIIPVSKEAVDGLVAGTVEMDDVFQALTDPEIKIFCLYKNGALHKAWILARGAASLTCNENIDAGETAYFRAEIYGWTDVDPLLRLLYGKLMCLTNPIYVNY
ncbi:MAG: hypothetical protein CVV44_10425 [Spirochaetae bacterium HGW-Spirochaetae-1]|jgi:hypothetical protein|nr:MAG: hypothetical protein CVV44_10425 [Spirochaetae bacterium HGW-Spirochaetae-1]